MVLFGKKIDIDNRNQIALTLLQNKAAKVNLRCSSLHAEFCVVAFIVSEISAMDRQTDRWTYGHG